jgi:hypothetical protein
LTPDETCREHQQGKHQTKKNIFQPRLDGVAHVDEEGVVVDVVEQLEHEGLQRDPAEPDAACPSQREPRAKLQIKKI